MDKIRIEKFHSGTERKAYEIFSPKQIEKDGKSGWLFKVWAPSALAVSLVGDFNSWDDGVNPMTCEGGIWTAFSSDAKIWDCYKFKIKGANGTHLKCDPYAYHYEDAVAGASKIYPLPDFKWNDSAWLKKREKTNHRFKPLNIYEVHLGSWKRKQSGDYYSYRELADELIPYVKDMGYTHLELLPVTEHPFDGSWGYQVSGMFAPTSRYGKPEDFMYFIDKAHRAGIGVILDWVSAHFPRDEHGLFEFDGTTLYEYSDPLKREHKGWGTVIFDYSKPEVKSFLISSADLFFDKYHIDGIRMDAVASMLYLDYCREEGQWRPNIGGGNYNLEAIDFIRELNSHVLSTYPGTMMIAEESTAFPMVTMPPFMGGLGFSYKWNMGWMNDNLEYLATDPIYKKHEHNKMTFSITYAFSENYVLPLSHDEVVHLKRSLLEKCPGSYDQKFDTLMTFLGFTMAHPGKKLLFMGGEIAQFIEWDYKKGLDWMLLDFERHQKFQEFVKNLNKLYKKERAFFERDHEMGGFEWIVVDDKDQNVFAVERVDNSGRRVICIANFSPVDRRDYRIGVKRKGKYKILLSSQEERFGGRGIDNKILNTGKIYMHGRQNSLSLNLKGNSVTFIALTR